MPGLPRNEVAALVIGYGLFFVAGPAAMAGLAWLFPCPFLPSQKLGLGIGAMSSGFGAFLVVWANIELWRKGHGGAADIGPVRISRRTDALVTTGPYAL
ncbi:MAG: hypothetical protein ACI4NA_04900, partial [Succinivibrio sp.]